MLVELLMVGLGSWPVRGARHHWPECGGPETWARPSGAFRWGTGASTHRLGAKMPTPRFESGASWWSPTNGHSTIPSTGPMA